MPGNRSDSGPFVGAGIEFSFAPSSALNDHIFEDRDTVTFVDTTGVALTIGPYSSDGTDMILGRLNYRFDGPVIAKH